MNETTKVFRDVMEMYLWWEFLVESKKGEPYWPTHVPVGEGSWEDAGYSDDDWPAITEAANEAKRLGYLDCEDPMDGARLTPKGVEAAEALFPDARAKWSLANAERPTP